MSYRTITIFSDEADFSQRPAPVLASILIHGIASGIISFGIMYSPRVVNATHEHYSLRHLDLHTPEARMRRPPGDINQNGQRSVASARSAVDRMAAYLPSPRQSADAKTGAQTLLQPDVPSRPELLQEIQVPAFTIWRPSKVPVKTIVAPVLEESDAADAAPSISAPNEELDVKDLPISSTDLPKKADQILPGTTSPVVIQQPSATQKPPVTVSQPSKEPTPVAVMSVSDLRMTDKTAVLPPVNLTAGSKTQDVPAAVETKNPAPQRNDRLNANSGEASKGQASIDKPLSQEHQTKSRAGQDGPGPATGDHAGFGPGSQGSATVITVSKSGRFGAVVVGTSLADRFPEVEGLWSGRLIYTVYLHVGLAQSWILQYSLPPSTEAAEAGNVAHLEAPWPYSILRPDLAPGSTDADALIVNGFISQDGRFEALHLVFPASFQQFEFVLHCLQQWQFRPAVQNGHPTRVEFMLIIPDQEE